MKFQIIVDIPQHSVELFIGSAITILMLAILAWAIRKFIGD